MKVVFIDIETGGLDMTVHPIIQIAAIACVVGPCYACPKPGEGFPPCQVCGRDEESPPFVELKTFETKVSFDVAAADPEALRINSYTPEAWTGAFNPSGARYHLATFLRRYASLDRVSRRTGTPYEIAQLAGHNAAAFDGPWLQSWYKLGSDFFPADYRILDTMQLGLWEAFRSGNHPKDFKLETLAAFHGVLKEAQTHDALDDVRLSIDLANALL